MLLLEPHQLADDIVKIMLHKFDIANVDEISPYFALSESLNGSSIDRALDADDKVAQVVNSWTDENAKLVFMIRLFMPCLTGLQFRDVVAAEAGKPQEMLSLEAYLELAQVIDPNCIHLQYLQAVYHVVTGQYPTTQDQALYLGALHFFFKFGEYVPNKHKLGFLGNRIVEFIPFKLLKKKPLDEWEQLLFSTVHDQMISGTYQLYVYM